jgi:hypothetical protein
MSSTTSTANEERASAESFPAVMVESRSAATSAATQVPTPKLSWFGKLRKFASATLHYCLIVPVRLTSLVVLLAVLSVVPILQFAVLGYLLELSARIARGKSLAESFQLLPQATRIGIAAAAIYLWTLPIQLLGYYAYLAELIEPGNPLAIRYRIGAFVVVALAFCHLGWAWLRGGNLMHYVWPQPIRFLTQIWRPRTWDLAMDRLWNFVVGLRIPSLVWLGFRGAVGALIWIAIPAVLLIATARNGETGLAAIIGTIGFLLMGWIVMYLPMLQVQFATDNRLRSMFAWRTIRQQFRNAPIAFWLGTSATLLFAIPLYLLKIEAIPKELVWLPAIFFVTLMLLAHVVTGWAMRRAINQEMGRRWWHALTRIVCRLLALPVVFGYLFFVYLSQLTSWDGLNTWLQQHAFMVPVPFTGT